MARQTKLVPKRRFKEFRNAGAWEHRELSELANFTKGSGYTKNDLRAAGSPIILYGRLYTDYQTLITEVNTFIEVKGNSVISSGGEVIVPSSGESAEDISRASVVGKPGIVLGGDLNIIKPNKQIDPIYLAIAISNGSPNRDMSKRAQGKSVVHLHNSDLKKINLSFPRIEEQRIIVKFYLQLDNLITLHQRKLDKVKALKSASLSEMFPAKDENVPQRRFAGFTDPWEQRELGEISDIRTGPFGSTLHAEDYVEEGTPIITTEHFKTGDLPEQKNGIPQVSAEDLLRLQNYVLKIDDIVFSRVGSVDINALVTSFQDGWLFSGRVLRVRTGNNVDSQYLHYELSTARAKNDVIARAVGQTMPSINTEILKQTKVFLPTEIKEQKNIGQFFAELDNLITLHQRKLEKLKNIKEAYLNEMFV
ncbi:restriction endonuclease subunit S [Paenibacillus sp. SYP-B4298]|uniref:restriction endonuclease subunit S n=1 Tax=Paenibacillus sp. SYP-B4298 TaxID=2996034 RepID=UPI0022DD6243|nr:restriction endonuclease subunit S [Paenibacillus sp. SYP-B4298]